MPDGIADAIRGARSILLASHVRPDGDALGSLLAFYHALRLLGKEVTAYCRDKIPSVYGFLPGSDRIVHNLDFTDAFDTVVLLDCSELSRVGDEAEMLKSIGTMIVIDHHLSNDGDTPLSLIDRKASSTGEILVRLFDKLGIAMTKEIAVNLYTAVVTDTGSFRYSNTTRDTFILAARLVEAGVEPWKISEQVYESKPLPALKLLALALETMTLELEGRMASIVVTQDMLVEAGALSEHTEGLIDAARSVEGVLIAVFYYEMPDGTYKISLRSKGSVDVERLAKKFGGGGHLNASACRARGDLAEIRERVRIAAVEILERTGDIS